MASNKSIDGLSPRRRKKSTISINADGFTPLQKPRKTQKTIQPPATTIHPEEFIPPRKTTQKSHIQPPKIASAPTAPRSNLATTKKTPPQESSEIAEVNEDFLEPLKAFDFDEETGELVNVKDNLEEDDKKARKSSRSKKSPKKKKWSKKRKIWTWVGIIFLILIIAGVVWFILWGNDLLRKLAGGGGDFTDLFEQYEPLKEDQYGRTNILAFGTSGFDMDGTDYSGEAHDGAQLTDSIMAISFDQDTGIADLISLPRDLYFDAGCNYTGKINEVYDCNNPDGIDETTGAKALADAMTEVLGIDFQYYAHVNWGALKSIVDAVGGITITLDEPVFDYGYTDAVYDPGVPYHLNGDQAVGLSRARYGTENGDFTRGASQQKILLGLKDRILEENLSVLDLINLANTLGDNLRTDFTVSELKSLAHIATTVDWNNITQASFLEPEPLLTDGTINGISYVYPTTGITNFSEIQAYIRKLLTANPDAEAIATENATILVLNSTSQDGLASTEQSSLTDSGFVNITIDNHSPALLESYTLYSFTSEKPVTQSNLERKYQISASPAPDDPSLPQGYDFILILGSPSSS